MIEKIRAVQNPLTVIAIFAALAEVAGTVALATVDKDLQHTFVWFVMAFPTLLVLFFFLTLNFNPRVLYAPSDFQNEENFLVLAGRNALTVSFQNLNEQLEVAKQQIIAETVEQVGAAGETERKKLIGIVSQQIELVREKVESTKESAEEAALDIATGYPHSDLQALILTCLIRNAAPMMPRDIAIAITRSVATTMRAIHKLTARGLVKREETGAVSARQ